MQNSNCQISTFITIGTNTDVFHIILLSSENGIIILCVHIYRLGTVIKTDNLQRIVENKLIFGYANNNYGVTIMIVNILFVNNFIAFQIQSTYKVFCKIIVLLSVM